MCGIGGIVRFGKAPITEEMIALILSGNEHRGVDATGMAFSFMDGSVKVHKQDIPAWKFVCSKEYYEFITQNLNDKVWAVLLHTRAATTGSPRVFANNHPLHAGKSAAIHNGMINNDKYVFDTLKLERRAETDSDILRAIVDKFGVTEKAIKEMDRLSGSVATAIVSPEHPRHMILARSGSPLTTASNSDGLFLFSSERNTLDRALKPWCKRFGMDFQLKRADAAFAPFADNTAWLIGPEGKLGHFPFKTMAGKYTEPHRQVYQNYQERQKRWDDKAKETKKKEEEFNDVAEATCPKCRMNWCIPKGKDARKFHCNKDEKGCGAKLVPLIRVN